MRWSWCAVVLLACSDSSTPTADPGPSVDPPSRGDGGAPDSGCGDTQSDPSHCGSCDVACPQADHQKASCLAGTCVAACEAGFDDCDGNAANGCEQAVSDDPNNCGACGRICATCGEATCHAGSCTPKVLATAQTGANDIAFDGTTVWWANRVVGGAIRRVKKDGTGAISTVVTADNPTDIIVSGEYVYWTRPAAAPSGEGLNRTPKPEIVGPFPNFVTGQDNPGGLVKDDDAFYWTRNPGLEGVLARCTSCNGGGVLDLATKLIAPKKLAIDNDSLAVVLGDAVTLFSKSGQNIRTLAVSQPAIAAITSDGKNVYVAEDAGIMRLPKDGSASVTFLPVEKSRAVRYLDGHLYFAGNGALSRIDADATHRVALASSLGSPGAMAVDDKCVYFIDADRILTVTK